MLRFPAVRIVATIVVGLAGAAWFLSISARRTDGRITPRREAVECVGLAGLLFAFWLAFGM